MAIPPGNLPSAPGDVIDFAAVPHSPDSTDEERSPSASPIPASSDLLRLPTQRLTLEPRDPTTMSASSTHIDVVNNALRPNPAVPVASGLRTPQTTLPESMEAKMRAFHESRRGTPPSRPQISMSRSSGPPVQDPPNFSGPSVGGLSTALRLPNFRPQSHSFVSAPAVPKLPVKSGLSARRGMKLPGGLPGAAETPSTPSLDGRKAPSPKRGDLAGSMFNKFSSFVDTKNGTLKFAGKAVIHGQGIDFHSGSNFNISLDEVDTLEELGKGNYGTVYKVRHARPRIRRPGLGLAGNKLPPQYSPLTPASEKDSLSAESSPKTSTGSTTGVVMAMKEIRLELDEAKFAAIIMELDILHRCLSPYIIDFYGAFFQEGAVYICIEFMDGGSIDKIYGDGIPEGVLRKITYATVQGLKTLKDDHNIIHRDVKPTNILVNTRGQVKICDFGVSGNLVASIAKTNIGCQSYMAPERISGGGIMQAGANPAGTYSVQSDIWSLGLSIIECAMGRYPYPPETYSNIFSQLSAIVEGDPPDLPKEGFSDLARDFVKGCLNKKPKLRPTYSMLLQHAWLARLAVPTTITEEDEDAEVETQSLAEVEVPSKGTEDIEVAGWVISALEKKKNGSLHESVKPALHAAPLDRVSPAASLG